MSDRADITVVKGSPDDDELAALAVVLTAVHNRPDAAGARPSPTTAISGWRTALRREVPRTGPRAWYRAIYR